MFWVKVILNYKLRYLDSDSGEFSTENNAENGYNIHWGLVFSPDAIAATNRELIIFTQASKDSDVQVYTTSNLEKLEQGDNHKTFDLGTTSLSFKNILARLTFIGGQSDFTRTPSFYLDNVLADIVDKQEVISHVSTDNVISTDIRQTLSRENSGNCYQITSERRSPLIIGRKATLIDRKSSSFPDRKFQTTRNSPTHSRKNIEYVEGKQTTATLRRSNSGLNSGSKCIIM